MHRFIYDMFDHLLPLLPVELRRQLLAGCRPALLKTLNTLQQEVNALALKRARQVRIQRRGYNRGCRYALPTDMRSCEECCLWFMHLAMPRPAKHEWMDSSS